MPGDWVVMRSDLEQDPAVFHLAKRLKCSRREVLGHLHACWAFFDRVSRDGHAHSVTGCDLDELVGVPGFAKAMQTTPESAWLVVADDGHVIMPEFDIWLSQSAKRRLLAMKRQRRYRERQHREAAEIGDAHVTQARDNNDTRVSESVLVLQQPHVGPAPDGASPPSGVAVVSPNGQGKKPKPFAPIVLELADRYAEWIKHWKPDAKVTVKSPSSLEQLRMLVETDRRDPDDVKALLAWLFGGNPTELDYEPSGPFDWRRNVLSGTKLRKHWDVLDDLFSQTHPKEAP